MHKRSSFGVPALALVLCVASAPGASADIFLDLTGVTPGTSGSFAGTLDGVGVAGSVTSTNPAFEIGATTEPIDFARSYVDNSSPQYSYGGVYAPSTPLTDQVGYSFFTGGTGSATITINFGSPIQNPIFHVANLDSMRYTFALAGGLTGLSLLSGNGGPDGDGIAVAGNVIADAIPATIVGQAVTDHPFLNGTPRSAYGSVMLLGNISTLVIDVDQPNLGGDGGSFTLSVVPEPSALTLAAAGGLVVLGARLRRRGRGA